MKSLRIIKGDAVNKPRFFGVIITYNLGDKGIEFVESEGGWELLQGDSNK